MGSKPELGHTSCFVVRCSVMGRAIDTGRFRVSEGLRYLKAFSPLGFQGVINAAADHRGVELAAIKYFPMQVLLGVCRCQLLSLRT